MRSQLIFTCKETYCFTGNGSKNGPNGIRDKNYDDILVIPKYFHDKKIKIIGKYSFYNCTKLKHVLIQADIESIEDHAFASSPSLTTINIPSTVKCIADAALSLYNHSNANVADGQPNAMGTLTVSFGSNSQLSSLGVSVFGRKEHYVIYLEDELKQLTCNGALYYSVNSFVVYSTKSFSFCSVNTKVVPIIDIYRDYRIIEDSLKHRIMGTCRKGRYLIKHVFFVLFQLK